MENLLFDVAYAATANKAQDVASTFNFEELIFTVMKIAASWVFAFIVIFVAFIIAKIVKTSVLRILANRYDEMHRDLLTFFGRMAFFLTLTFGILVACKAIGVDITTILGGLMVGFGFALRDVLANFAAGIVILFQRQFVSGQAVMVDGDFLGTIEDIQTRTTIVRGFDGTMIIVPNTKLLTNTVVNFSANDFRRHEISVGVSYDDDLRKASEVIAESLKKHKELVPELPPAVLITNFGDSSIDFTVRVWLESKAPFPAILSKIMQQLKSDFDEAGITIPWPITTLKVEKEDVAMFKSEIGKTKNISNTSTGEISI